MKFILLLTLLISNLGLANAQNISVTTKARETTDDVNAERQLSGEIIEIKPDQVLKEDIKPKSAIQDNIITVNGGSNPLKERIFGADDNKNVVKNNTVNLTKGTYLGDIFGGQSYDMNSEENKININGVVSYGTIFGGASYHGEAFKNSINISDTTLTKRVLGGQSHEGVVLKNNVDIKKSIIRESIYGGFSYQGDSAENSVMIEDTSVGNKLYGGFSRDKDSRENSLSIKNTTTTDIIYGGASTNGNALSNTLTIFSGNIFGDVYGGYSDFGNVSGNTLLIKGGKFTRNIYDGYSQSGKVENNKIIIEGGNFMRTSSIISNYITISNSPMFNSSLIIFGRCDGSIADADCLIKFENFKGSHFNSIAHAKKVEIDSESTVIFSKSGMVKIGGDLDIKGIIGFIENNSSDVRAIMVNNLKAENALIVLSNNDHFIINGKAEGNAVLDLRFPSNNAKILNTYKIFDGDLSGFEYKLKSDYILNKNDWHSYKVAINKEANNYINVLSKRTIYADKNIIAIPIELKQDAVDKVEIYNDGSININNGTGNLITTSEVTIDKGSILMDYNDFFVVTGDFNVKDASLTINVSSAKAGKYKLFADKKGNVLDTSGFKNIEFSEKNSTLDYKLKDGILEVSYVNKN
ncbi:MAG: hypothetical protein BWY78_00363 [Alphaproteobacteria bacterium ADurb.Bin438]|nr:MAG: hypothetical protein BWY78_00363 [Alphaproteobacteria bacterium ADurb.Bin438]